jgi:4'-phosphopantetheinyl transferase
VTLRDEIHLRWVNLDSAGPSPALQAVLSPEERARASRFAFARDRRRFIAARVALRSVLAGYLRADAGAIRFIYGPAGKPALAGPSGDPICFNMAHSCGLALIGVTRGLAVGVDVERTRTDIDVDGITSRFFSAAEAAAIAALPAQNRYEAFFACWTRKEAYLKARGTGLALPLDGFDVSVEPDAPTVRLQTRPDAGDADRWRILPVEAPQGFAAAVAVAVAKSAPPSTVARARATSSA